MIFVRLFWKLASRPDLQLMMQVSNYGKGIIETISWNNTSVASPNNVGDQRRKQQPIWCISTRALGVKAWKNNTDQRYGNEQLTESCETLHILWLQTTWTAEFGKRTRGHTHTHKLKRENLHPFARRYWMLTRNVCELFKFYTIVVSIAMSHVNVLKVASLQQELASILRVSL